MLTKRSGLRRERTTLAAILIALGVGIAPSLFAQPGDALAQERSRDLGALRARIAILEARLAESKQQGRSLEEQLARSAAELSLQEAKVAEAVAARASAAAAVAEVEQRSRSLTVELESRQAELRRRLRLLQRLGGQGYLGLLLGIGDRNQALEGVRLVRYLVRRDARAIGEVRRLSRALEGSRRERAAHEREVTAWLRREEERRSVLRSIAERQRSVLAELERSVGAQDAEATALRQKEERLRDLVETFATAPLDGAGLASVPIGRFRGALDPPIAGELLVPFGPRRDPRYGTTVPNNGIELSCPEPGSQVRAVYPGRVLFAAPFEGFGHAVVIQHGEGALTLYAGLTETLVHSGDMLDLSAVGRCTDRVYFELRIDNRPQDPTVWLR